MIIIDTEHPIENYINIIKENIKQNMVVAEVGVLHGQSTVEASKIVKNANGKYIAIDWFFGSISMGDYDPKNFSLDLFKRVLAENNCLDFVTIIPKSSEEASYDIEDNSLDICFIDADHSYEFVKKDILNYLPKIKNGGVLCGHDLEPCYIDIIKDLTEEELKMDSMINDGCSFHPGVIKAVDEIFGLDNIRIHGDSVWSIIINK